MLIAASDLARRAAAILDAGAEDVTDAMVWAFADAHDGAGASDMLQDPDVGLIKRSLRAALAVMPRRDERAGFQDRVKPWLLACFGETIAGDREERNHRFLEEALELVQACGCTGSEAHQLVDYVFGRSVGDPAQEVGGVMVTLAALCLANDLDMHKAGEVELARIWTKVEKIRAKQAAKPKHSPLPGTSTPEQPRDDGWQPIRELVMLIAEEHGGLPGSVCADNDDDEATSHSMRDGKIVPGKITFGHIRRAVAALLPAPVTK